MDTHKDNEKAARKAHFLSSSGSRRPGTANVHQYIILIKVGNIPITKPPLPWCDKASRLRITDIVLSEINKLWTWFYLKLTTVQGAFITESTCLMILPQVVAVSNKNLELIIGQL